jgi:DNA mismatch repair protein MutS2
MNRDGQVVALANREGRVLVETGGIRLEIPASDLEPPKGKARAKPHGAALAPPPKDAAYELDLRGLRVEEARAALDRFLDRAAVCGLPSVRIIHGIGTGKVRAEVGAALAEDPRVGSFRLGDNGGFTLVEMG